MLHLKPIQEADANEKVSRVYTDIKETFDIQVVPLVFRYLANYEAYFLYVWEKLKKNIESNYFQKTAVDINNFAYNSILEIYTPSRLMQTFIGKLNHAEKQAIIQTVKDLDRVNSQLFILTIGIREGVKGVLVGREALPYTTIRGGYEEVFETFPREKVKQEEKDIAAASKMLAPLFGSSSLMVSQYPSFFSNIAQEMENLVKEESFLQERVLLEHEGFRAIEGLQHPLGTSYQEIAQFASGKPYFNELLYVLAETFPSQFPRLVMTTAMMRDVLLGRGKSLAKM